MLLSKRIMRDHKDGKLFKEQFKIDNLFDSSIRNKPYLSRHRLYGSVTGQTLLHEGGHWFETKTSRYFYVVLCKAVVGKLYTFFNFV